MNTIIGHASNPDTLNAAGAKDADMMVAVTQSDEVNMVACQIGHSLFGIPKKMWGLAWIFLFAIYKIMHVSYPVQFAISLLASKMSTLPVEPLLKPAEISAFCKEIALVLPQWERRIDTSSIFTFPS